MIPLNADRIEWDFPRPWGGGHADSRSIRIYYGLHSLRATANKHLTSRDKAWVQVDDSIPPEEYDWSFIAGHEAWLYPVGFTVTPYSRKLAKVLADNHAHRVLMVQGFDQDVLNVIEEMDYVDWGMVKPMHRHKYLQPGEM